MGHFEGCKTQDEFKQRYKELAKKNHPDLGGCVEAMKEINEEYELGFRANYKASDKNLDGVDVEDLLKEDRELRAKLYSILGVEGIEIELCGVWLWVTGNTIPVKDVLKRNGFKWASKKKAWYFHTGDYKKRSKKRFSLDEIRSIHGSSVVNNNFKKAIA